MTWGTDIWGSSVWSGGVTPNTRVLIVGLNAEAAFIYENGVITAQPVGTSFYDVHTMDGVTWFAVDRASSGRLWRYIHGTGWTNLGTIGTGWQYSNCVHALSAIRAFIGYTSSGWHEFDNGVERDHTPNPTGAPDQFGFTAFEGETTRILCATNDGKIYEWDGGTNWDLHSTIPDLDGFTPGYGIYAAASDAIWVVGINFGTTTGRIWFWNGSTWNVQHTGTVGSSWFAGIHGSSRNNVFVTDVYDQVLRWNGTSWLQTLVTPPGTHSFYDVSVISNVEAYVVGSEFVEGHDDIDDFRLGVLYVMSEGVWSDPIYTSETPGEAVAVSAYQLLGPDPGPVTSSTKVDNTFVVAQNVLMITFNGTVINNQSLRNVDNYTVENLSGGSDGVVIEILPTYERATSFIFCRVNQLIEGQRYRLKVKNLSIYDNIGRLIPETSVTYLMHKTKVDMVIRTLSDMYDKRIGSNLRSIVEALMISDEKIGGDF